ncbi:MAG: GNAT family N-acetyltransferase [Proteobacteria bacterium]|nr:GNAT family N-acetyltransferase [Pseudomonadota bacterium]MBU1686620.1 GNAT family N-acetyltransferase [Pseudomonadota bacterium]
MLNSEPNHQPKIRIREMTIDDLPHVYHIGENIFTAEYSSTLYRTWDEYEITTLFNSDNELCLVAELNDQIAGFALGTTVDKHHSAWKYGYLVWLGVRKDVQMHNIGERLFREIKRRMREQGARIIIIDTDAENRAAINFFKKHGFGNVEKHVYMSMNLDKTKKPPGKRNG